MKNIHNRVLSDTPNYALLIDNSLPLPVNPYSRTDIDAKDIDDTVIQVRNAWKAYQDWSQNGKWMYTNDVGVKMQTGRFAADIFGNFVPTVSMFSNELVKAENRLLKKMKSTSVSILMALKERKQTESMILTFAESLIKLWRYKNHPIRACREIFGRYGWKNRERLVALRAHRTIINRAKFYDEVIRLDELYMAYRFGIVPLVCDIQEAVQAISEACERYRCKSVCTGFNLAKDLPSWGAGAYIGVSAEFGSIDYYSHTATGEAKFKYRTGVRYRVDSELGRFASAFADIPVTLWDSVPLSFIIDNIINVTKYLDLRNASLGLVFESGFMSASVMYTATAKPSRPFLYHNSSNNWRYELHSMSKSQMVGTYFTFQRQVRKTFPQPSLEIPMYENAQWAHALDLLALSRSRLRN